MRERRSPDVQIIIIFQIRGGEKTGGERGLKKECVRPKEGIKKMDSRRKK